MNGYKEAKNTLPMWKWAGGFSSSAARFGPLENFSCAWEQPSLPACLPVFCFLWETDPPQTGDLLETPYLLFFLTYGFGTRRGAACTILTRRKEQSSVGHLTAAFLSHKWFALSEIKSLLLYKVKRIPKIVKNRCSGSTLSWERAQRSNYVV